ncbi:hypothetical protein K7432_000866 [Basidiobolus ranarum]|uniref:Chitin-binding type-4 domain-containing protein n=1 Tax=Basidiobolus ranarum TaxID=34480 RepID=A0ABR2WAL7_9FUNG
MELKFPYPRGSVWSPFYSKNDPDFDVPSPLDGARSYPCQGKAKGPSQANFEAGEEIPVEIVGPNTHMGGHCQFAVSYDGETFVVIKDIMKDCMTVTGTNIPVKLPAELDEGEAIFAWSWINAQANREYYMNCVDITITKGTQGGVVSGPQLLVVNLPGYETIDEFYYPWISDGQKLFDDRPVVSIAKIAQ